MAALRYVAEAVRIRLLALRYTAARRGFLATRMALRIGAAQSKFKSFAAPEWSLKFYLAAVARKF